MNVVQTALTSARFNRLLLWLAAGVLAAGVAVFVFALSKGSDTTTFAPDRGFRPTLPERAVPLTNAQGVTVRTFEQLDPQARSALRTFIATAVAGEHLDRSWAVVAPSMKVGYTYRQWKTGDELPIVPYPVGNIDAVNYYLDYASTKDVLIEVGMSAKPSAHVRAGHFRAALSPVGKGAQKRWLVSYWMPLWTPPLPAN